MDFKEYKRIKKIDIKKWLLGGNAKVYAFILVLFLAAVIFVFKTIGNMSQDNIHSDEDTLTEQSNESESVYVTNNMSYMIRVNKTENFITIYKIDSNGEFNNAYKTFRCSVNPKTDEGETVISEKSVWRALNEGGYGHYVTKLDTSAYIHSVPYTMQDISKLNTTAYNNLGKSATVGSIYLAAADAKWIYENCGVNSKVIIYSEAGENPAIALADFKSVAAGTQYDPSDTQISQTISAASYIGKIDYMDGVKDTAIDVGSSFDKWSGIYAVDVIGNDITSKITIEGDVDVNTPGVYTLIYRLSDNYGTNLAYYRYITVNEVQSTTGIQSTTADNSNEKASITQAATVTVPNTKTEKASD